MIPKSFVKLPSLHHISPKSLSTSVMIGASSSGSESVHQGVCESIWNDESWHHFFVIFHGPFQMQHVFFVLQNENWLEAGGCPPKETCLGAPIDQGGSESWLAVPHRHWSLHRRHDFSMEVGVFWKLISKTHLQSVGCTPSFKMNGESPMTAFPNYVFALEAPNRFSAAWWNHCDIVLVWWHEPGWLNLMRLKVVKANPRPA